MKRNNRNTLYPLKVKEFQVYEFEDILLRIVLSLGSSRLGWTEYKGCCPKQLYFRIHPQIYFWLDPSTNLRWIHPQTYVGSILKYTLGWICLQLYMSIISWNFEIIKILRKYLVLSCPVFSWNLLHFSLLLPPSPSFSLLLLPSPSFFYIYIFNML